MMRIVFVVLIIVTLLFGCSSRRLAVEADNLRAEEVLEKNGVKWTPQPDQENLKKFAQAGVKTRKSLRGKIFPPELLIKVLGYLVEIK